MRKSLVVAVTAISLVLSAPLATAGGKATPKPVKAAAAKSLCASTDAVGHPPKEVSIPTLIKNRNVNKIFTLNTNCGKIVFEAFTSKAPTTVSAMTSLANQGFFDASLCHRLTTALIFVLQCGDPTAEGGGGPKFTYRDENLPKAEQNNYPAGTVAMANSGPGPNNSGTNSSQFFLVYANTTLPPNYTIWGQITQGLDIVKAVAAKGVANGSKDGAPAQTIALEKVTVK